MDLRKNIKATFLAVWIYIFALSAMAAAATHDLVIYHTNDVHGYAFEERNKDGRLTRIGYDRLKAVVDADVSPRKLLLDAGDVLHGQAFATAKRGELSALVLSMTGYDALTAGNHDFDYGYERLLELSGKYRLKFLVANLKYEQGGAVLPSCMVRSWGDLKVGIFGLMTPETQTSTDPRNIVGLVIEDPIKTAGEMVKKLKAEGADVIVALTHMGSEPYCKPMSQTVAEEVSGLDLVIDGHSHSEGSITVKRKDGSTGLVVSTGAYFKNLGRVTADRDPRGGFTFFAQTLPASDPEMEAVSPDPAMREAVTVLQNELDKELSQTVMKAPFDLDGARERVRSGSTNMGRIICASMMEAAGADAALLNGGSIRGSIPAGDVTKGQLLSVLPYGNYIYTVEIMGKDLLDALNHGLGQPDAGAFPQFWGMEVTARETELTGSDGTKKKARAVESLLIGGAPLANDKKYTIAINDFMYAGGDGYKIFVRYGYREFATLEEAFRNFVTEKSGNELKTIGDATVLK